MRVAVNFRSANLGIPDGHGESARGLVGGLARTNPGHGLDLLADAPPRVDLPRGGGVRFRRLRPFPAGARMLRRAAGGDPWYRVRVGAEGLRRRWDVYVQSAHEPPPMFGVRRRVVVAHDLAFLHADASHNFDAATAAELDRWTAANAHAADAVLAVSAYVGRDAARTYGVDPQRISVAPHGVDRRRFRPDHPAAEVRACRARHGLDADYVLFVGTIQPRKNLPALVEAVRRARAAGLNAGLAAAGAEGWRADASLDAIARAGPATARRLGRVAAGDLPLLLAGARAFVSMAHAEGFGMPALEAMASGVPVVAADDAGLAEVVQDAGLRVDPRDPDAIAHALLRVTRDDDLRRTLVRRGLDRAAGFTWDTAARTAWRAIEQTCASC